MTRRGTDPSEFNTAQDPEERRREKARGRAERHGLGPEHATRTCPACRRSLPYMERVHDPPRVCGECGYAFECPECGVEFDDDERAEDGGVPGVCPTCDAVLDEDRAAEASDEESFTWD